LPDLSQPSLGQNIGKLLDGSIELGSDAALLLAPEVCRINFILLRDR